MPQDGGDILLGVCFQVHHDIVGPKPRGPWRRLGFPAFDDLPSVSWVGVDQYQCISRHGVASYFVANLLGGSYLRSNLDLGEV